MGACCSSTNTFDKKERVVSDKKNNEKPDSGEQISIDALTVKKTTVHTLGTCDEVINIIHGPVTASTPTRINEWLDDFVSVSSTSDVMCDTPITSQ
jgi:hypothetical protein